MSAAVVSDDLLSAILSDQVGRKLIPCTDLASKPAKSCNCKRDRAHVFNQAELESVKICLTRLTPERLAQLKNFWKVDRVIIHLRTPGLPPRVVL